MKFIISNFSPSMINHSDFNLKWHQLNEDEFQALAYDAYSCIGAEDIAQSTGFAHNREAVKCRAGDVLLLAKMERGALVFYCIQVLESDAPLIRETEILCEEVN